MEQRVERGRTVERLEAAAITAQTSYGKACVNCVKSKTKCAGANNEGKCDRCRRLKKECQSAPTVRKKRVLKGPTTSASSVATKTAALEEKIDGIVQLLQRSQPVALSTTQNANLPQGHLQVGNFGSNAVNYRITAGGPGANSSQSTGESTYYYPAQAPPTPAASCIDTALDTTSNNYSGTNASLGSVLSPYALESEKEKDGYLETYRTNMVAFYPIVCIRPELTVKDLEEQRPFLWLVIRAICNKNLVRQKALLLEVRKFLGREMLVESTKSLDLFLGLLVFAAWGHYHVSTKPIISTIIQLGMSLAFDLGLTKAVALDAVGIMLNYTVQGCPRPASNATNPVRTMEERRAVVGLFLNSAVSANYFQRIEPLPWTPYLEECLRFLEEKHDYPTDALLVRIVRAQLICNAVALVPWNDAFGISGTGVPRDFYVKTFTAQLDELRRVTPPELRSNETLQLHILHTVVCIHEHSLNNSSSQKTLSDSTSQLKRLESLWACFTATKSWFSKFFSLDLFPLSCYTEVSMAIFAQLSHCLVVLFRLSTFESPNVPWDTQRIRQELDLGKLVELWAERWDGIPAAAGLETNTMSDKGDDPWSFTKRKLFGIAKWWEAREGKVAAISAAEVEKDGSHGVEHGTVDGFGEQQMDTMDFTALSMDMFDDVWMGGLLGGRDYATEPYF